MKSEPRQFAELLDALAAGRNLKDASGVAGLDPAEAAGQLRRLAQYYRTKSPAKAESAPAASDQDVKPPVKGADLVVYSDGGARGNPGKAGFGVVLYDKAGHKIAESKRFLGIMTNNEAEYSGLIHALERAAELGAAHIEVRLDSELLVRQMSGIYKVKARNLLPLFISANKLARQFGSIVYTHVPREENREADRLANEAMDQGV